MARSSTPSSSSPRRRKMRKSRRTIDLCPLCAEAARGREVSSWRGVDGSFKIRGHESRIRQALKMFFEGASRVLMQNGRSAAVERTPGRFTVAVTGKPARRDFEMTKIFKFYYTDRARQCGPLARRRAAHRRNVRR